MSSSPDKRGEVERWSLTEGSEMVTGPALGGSWVRAEDYDKLLAAFTPSHALQKPWEDSDPCTMGLYRLATECGWSEVSSRPPELFIRDKLASAPSTIAPRLRRWTMWVGSAGMLNPREDENGAYVLYSDLQRTPSATACIEDGPLKGLPKPVKVPEGYVMVDEKSFKIILDVLTEEQTREICMKEGERLYLNRADGGKQT